MAAETLVVKNQPQASKTQKKFNKVVSTNEGSNCNNKYFKIEWKMDL